jgi:chorismate mutase
MLGQMKIQPLSSWIPNLAAPLIIAGPCSAESEEQVITTARALKKLEQVKIFRAGIWKPRTRPNNFEGHGEIALPWLREVKKETGLLTTTEVATAKHVELALKHGIDILWIGARTTANPFSVQEIADSLSGVDIPIMVKNPINADLQLWIGALERLSHAGIEKLVAIHRGFSVAHQLEMRNDPLWRIPIELKLRFQDLPIICDPSHITGKSELIESVCQKAMDINMDGLIIETHMSPKDAWSDALQQITPDRLNSILNKLILKSPNSGDENFDHLIENLRAQIDQIDHEIIHTLKHRKDIVLQIAKAKHEKNITALQLKRFNNLIIKRVEAGTAAGLDENFIKEIFDSIHDNSVKLQTDFFDRLKS